MDDNNGLVRKTSAAAKRDAEKVGRLFMLRLKKKKKRCNFSSSHKLDLRSSLKGNIISFNINSSACSAKVLQMSYSNNQIVFVSTLMLPTPR